MKVYYVNRADREDRNYLFRGAMAAMGFAPEDLIRVIAMNREDYPTRQALCDAGAADGFSGFFERMRYRKHPGYGHLVGGWSMMRSWRMIAEQDETALHIIDDYYIKQPHRALCRLIAPLDDLNIAMLAWHTRDDVFFLDRFDLNIPYRHTADKTSAKSRHFLEGGWYGCADWALVMSPEGAAMLLEYMENESPINAECAVCAMQHLYKDFPGIYSLKNQPRDVNGDSVLTNNPWVGHLVEFTDGLTSNLVGTHELIDTDSDRIYKKNWMDD